MTNEVKRYGYGLMDDDLHESPVGPYVRWEDYDRLDKKCAALACLLYGRPESEPEAPQRCCCGSQDWPPGTLQIECSRGVLHFLDKPCHHK